MSLYPFTLPQEYSSIVAEFLGSSSNLSKAGDDLFYFKVQEYEKLLASIQSLKRELHTLQINSKLEISKIWVMKRESKSVVSSCKDGIEISHTVNSEIAHFEEEPVRELEASFEKIRHESHVNLSSLQFKVKLAKLWIQNYVDEMLELYYDDESAFSKSRGKDHVKSSGVLENTLDILFYFERRITNRIVSAISSSTDSTKKNNSSSSLSGASGLSDYESDAKDSSSSGMFSLFTRDIRGWITHIASFLLLKRPLEYNVYILLHCLRTPGIGTWGSSFVQWSMERYYQSGLFFTMAGFENMKPGLKMVYPIECYLLSLKYLFSSLLEKEEQRQLYLFEKLHIRESLKHLEKNSDWIVLDDDQLKQDVNYKSKDPIEVLVLTDQDYLSLLNQFSLEETWDHIIQHWKGRLVPYIAARYSAGASDTGLSNEMVAGILEIFAQYTHFVGILSRCSDSFDLNRYPKMSRRVGECLSKMLVKLTNVFQDSGLESLVSQCNEEYIQRFVTPSRLMKDLITVTTNSSSAVVAAKLSRTSLESEMERTILITMKAFLDFDEGTWWKFLKYLPVSQLSLETRQRVLVNYNSYSSSSSSSSSSTSSLSNVIPSENDNLLHLLKTRVGEAHLVLEFFSNLALQPIVDNFATNNNNDNTQTSSALVQQQQQQEMLIQMASAIFKNCYVSWASLYEGVSETTEKLEAIKSNLFISRKLIKDMCVLFPALQAFIITWIREILSTKNRPDTLKMALLKLIKELPLNLWRPSQDELEMILDMLKDPDSEFHKYAIGRWVLQSLSWGQNDDLPIPRYYHRIVAFTLCNICLDRGIVKEVSPPANSTASKGVLGTVGHVAYETVHLAAGAVNIAAGGVGSIVGSAAGVVGSKTKELIDWSGFGTSEFDEVHALGLDDHDFDFINVAGVKGVVEDEFVSWCW